MTFASQAGHMRSSRSSCASRSAAGLGLSPRLSVLDGLIARRSAGAVRRARPCCRHRRRPAARPCGRSPRRPGGRAPRRRASTKPVSTSTGSPAGLPSRERHEHHLVAAARLAVPRAVLADEGAAAIGLRQRVAFGEGEPERRDVRAERVVRHDRLGDQVGPRRLHARRRRAGRNSCRASRRSRRPAPRSGSRARGRCRSRRAR